MNAVDPKLEFEELVVGTGGKCGSTYIDREFIKWMTGKFGPAYTSVSWDKRGPASRFMKDFEVRLTTYRPTSILTMINRASSGTSRPESLPIVTRPSF